MKSKRILIADDHALFLMGIRFALEARGFEVVAEAAGGYEAINLAMLERPDLAILDIKMPELDGFVACREIKKVSPETIVVMLSTFDEPAILQSAKLAGATAYFSKEIDIAELANKLTDIMFAPQYPWFPQVEVPELSKRELDVLSFLLKGHSNKEIAVELSISTETIKDYLHSIYRKLDVSDRLSAAQKSRELGLLMFEQV